jgi:hypothetical protein
MGEKSLVWQNLELQDEIAHLKNYNEAYTEHTDSVVRELIREIKRYRAALEFIADTDRFDLTIVQAHAKAALEEK